MPSDPNAPLQSLEADLREALRQQAATSEVLRVISESRTELPSVFATILRHAVELCGIDRGVLLRLEDKRIHMVAHHGEISAEGLQALHRTYPVPLDDGSIVGRALLARDVVQVPDFDDLDVKPRRMMDIVRAVDFKAQLSVPLLRDGEPIGAISLVRRTAGPFSEGQIRLLRTFADQAVIAIENVRLLNELASRTRELARSVEHLTALGEVGRAVGSTLDLDTVLTAIVARAVDLSAGDGGVIYEYDEVNEVFELRATENLPEPFVDMARRTPLPRGEGVAGQLAELRRPVQVSDVASWAHRGRLGDVLVGVGYRAVLAVPLLHEDRLLGALAVTRKSPGEFPADVVALLQAFATQSALAIHHARLYRQLEAKRQELEAADLHKAELLKELEQWNHTLERRVAEQVAHVERLGRLKRFFSPQLAELIVVGGADDPLKTHRREVTVVFLDLRGFTAFAETAEPEEVMSLLREYHRAMGTLILSYEGTVERFTGDGMMIFFNDPVPIDRPAERAVRMAVAMREELGHLSETWRRHGHALGLGVGIAQGYATIGAIGFEGRWDYGAIGTVTNLAARLCGEAAAGQILVSGRVAAEVEELARVEEIGALSLKGLARPVPAWNVVGLRAPDGAA